MSEKLNRISARITQPKSQGASQAMLYATGLARGGHGQGPGRDRERLVRGQPLQHAPGRPGREGQAGRVGRGPRRHAVQHDRRLRRHLDGDRGHELLAPVPRPHRRLHRNGDGRPVVRRQHLAAGLRQEHARLHDGHGAAQPAVAHDLRRHDQAGLRPRAARSSTSCRRSSATASSSPDRIDEETRREIVRHACPGAGACGGMYTANTMASAIEALGMSLPYSSSTPAEDPAEARGVLPGRRGDPDAAREEHQAQRHHDPRGLRERHGHRHGARRLDQRRAAPHRHGALRRRTARRSTTSRP